MRPLRSYEIACTLLFACALGAVALAQTRAQQRPRTIAPRDVRAIGITHLPDDFSTRQRLTLERMRQIPGVQRVTLTEREPIVRFVTALANRSPSRRAAYDARWEFSVSLRDGTRTVVGCNAFGNAGAIDGVPARLRLAAVLRDFEHRYPALRGTCATCR